MVAPLNFECSYLSGEDPDYFLRLLDDGQKSKYSIRTVKLLQVTLIEQSNIQVSHIISLIEQSNVSTEATQVYLWIHP